MDAKQTAISFIQELGYKAEIDSDGDVMLLYQLKTFYIIIDEDRQHAIIMYPHVGDMEEEKVAQTLAVCNKLTRQIKFCKTYIDANFQNVVSQCEFYYTDEESLKLNINHGLEVLGFIRSQFRKEMAELEG